LRSQSFPFASRIAYRGSPRSPVSSQFLSFWKTEVSLSFGSFEFRHSLRHLINDGLMVIEIHVAAERPEGVPEENWLPITREDLDLDIILRVYVPDLERLESWSAPRAERVK